MTFRAQCSNCLRVSEASAERQPCPNCGERRLVRMDGGRAAPEPRSRKPARPDYFDPAAELGWE